MVESESNTSRASYKTGEQAKAVLQSSNHMELATKQSPSSSVSLSVFSVWTLSIDMLM